MDLRLSPALINYEEKEANNLLEKLASGYPKITFKSKISKSISYPKYFSIEAYDKDKKEFIGYVKKFNKKEQELLDVINTMLSLCTPIRYDEFNTVIKSKNIEDLRYAERENPVIGLANYGTKFEGISTLSIIATITEILIKKRLAFNVDENNIIKKVCFYDDAISFRVDENCGTCLHKETIEEETCLKHSTHI